MKVEARLEKSHLSSNKVIFFTPAFVNPLSSKGTKRSFYLKGERKAERAVNDTPAQCWDCHVTNIHLELLIILKKMNKNKTNQNKKNPQTLITS